MSKQSKKSKPPVPAAGRCHRGRARLVVILASVCTLLAAGYGATRYTAVRRAVGLRPLLAPAAPQQGSLPLAKEYVYAGGRLVATEEPAPAATPGPAPTNLVATANAFSPPTATVKVTWDAPSAGGVTGYVVERAAIAGDFQPVGQPVLAPATVFYDTASEGSAYLYRVKAVYEGGTSGYSNADLATAVAFTDAPLQGAVIKADHLKELRRAVNAVRALAGGGLGAASWSYPDPVALPASQRRPVYVADVTDLRERLDEALGPLGMQTPYPEDPPLRQYSPVYAAHFEQIRARVK